MQKKRFHSEKKSDVYHISDKCTLPRTSQSGEVS